MKKDYCCFCVLRARFILVGLFLAAPFLGRAHDVLGSFVQHSVRMAVSAQHLDVTLELTFFEEWSAHERRVMDTDRNGAITRGEQDAYLKRIESEASQQVKLLLGTQELPLAPLYTPELDLLGNSGIGPAHHRLTLFLFAAIPVGLRAGDEITLEERLWPGAKVIANSRAQGQNGLIVSSCPLDGGSALLNPGAPKLFKFKCSQCPSPETIGPVRSQPSAKRASGLNNRRGGLNPRY